MKKMLGCILTLAMLLVPAFETAAEENRAAATVNGEEILQTELENMVSTLSSRMALYGIEASDESTTEIIRSSALQELVDDCLLTQDMTTQGCYDT